MHAIRSTPVGSSRCTATLIVLLTLLGCGGFGAELTPTDVDTIADLQGFPAVLEEAGIAAGDIEGILHENALHFFRTAWSS